MKVNSYVELEVPRISKRLQGQQAVCMIKTCLPSSITLASLWLLQTTPSILFASIWMYVNVLFFDQHFGPGTIFLDPLARSRYPILKKISRHSSIIFFFERVSVRPNKGSSSGCDKRTARRMVRMGNSCYGVGCVFFREQWRASSNFHFCLWITGKFCERPSRRRRYLKTCWSRRVRSLN